MQLRVAYNSLISLFLNATLKAEDYYQSILSQFLDKQINKKNMTILLIEDDSLLALKYQMMIEKLGYNLVGNCKSIEEAKSAIVKKSPDLIVSDVMLGDHFIFEIGDILHKMPTVFITSFSQEALQEKAMQFPKAQFLIKPFHALSLKSAIERLEKDYILIEKNPNAKEGIEVVGKHRQKRLVPLSDICWIETEGNYSTICTTAKKYSLKISLRKLQEQLDKDFVQVHKAYILNLRFVNRVDLSQGTVNVNGVPIPLGRSFKKEFLEAHDKNNG